MQSTTFQNRLNILRALLPHREFDFPSDKPVIGPIIRVIRVMWNNIASRWYIQYYANQQAAFDKLLLDTFQDMAIYQTDLAKRISKLENENLLLTQQNVGLTQQNMGLTQQLHGLSYSLEAIIRHTQMQPLHLSNPTWNDNNFSNL